MTKLLGSWIFWVLWDWLQSSCPRSAQDTGLDQKDLCHWSGRVPQCLGPAGPSYFQCCGRCCILLTSDPMILGVLDHLRVELPLGVVGLTAEFVSKVCLGH